MDKRSFNLGLSGKYKKSQPFYFEMVGAFYIFVVFLKIIKMNKMDLWI